MCVVRDALSNSCPIFIFCDEGGKRDLAGFFFQYVSTVRIEGDSNHSFTNIIFMELHVKFSYKYMPFVSLTQTQVQKDKSIKLMRWEIFRKKRYIEDIQVALCILIACVV